MSTPAPSAPTRLVLPIQYLRGIAAVMVVWFHAVEQVPGTKAFLSSGFGNSGVDLFFVISGFIMVATTFEKPPSPVEFLRRRAIRVAPLYWLLTLAMVGAALCLPRLFKTLVVAPDTLLMSLLFIPHYSASFPTMAWPLLVPGWTLNYEMFFYLLFACTLVLPARHRLAALAGACVALVAAGLAFGPFANAVARTYTSPMLLEFAAGAAIGTWWVRRRKMPPAAVAAAAVVIGFALLVLRDQPPLGGYTQMCGAVLAVAGALHPAFAALRLPGLRTLGDASYSLYLTHLFALGVLRVLWTRAVPVVDSGALAAAWMALALVACAAVGVLSYRWIETPMLHRLNALTSRRRTLAAARA